MKKKKKNDICHEVTLEVTKRMLVKVAELLIKRLWCCLDELLF